MTSKKDRETEAGVEDALVDRTKPAVPERAKRGGLDMPEAWAWVEGTIWTARMVQALQNGVKGGVWYSLWDKIIRPESLRAAFAKVKANRGSSGTDHVTVQAYEQQLDRNIVELHDVLRTGRYKPSSIRRQRIPKPGSKETRALGIPTVRDRVVQTVLAAGIEPIFEREFADCSYGYRPGRSAKDALTRVDKLLCAGYTWVVDVDLKSYFDTVPHGRLLALVRERVADGKVLGLIEAFLKAPVQESNVRYIPEVGTPQGGVISPVLSNIYLNPLDHHMGKNGFEMTRYADDIVVPCMDEAQAGRALREIERWCSKAGLAVHPTKTRIVRVTENEGFDFLGFHFRLRSGQPNRTRKWPRDKAIKKLKDRVRLLTPRQCGVSIEDVAHRVSLTLRGFFTYFRASPLHRFEQLDRWVRMLLRSILRCRHRRKGPGRGADHQRWPNKYFEQLRLFSMAKAWAAYRHSPSG
jgi:RNA-directed DNA polymerase